MNKILNKLHLKSTYNSPDMSFNPSLLSFSLEDEDYNQASI